MYWELLKIGKKMQRLSTIFAIIGIALILLSGYLFSYRPSGTTNFQNSQDVWDPFDPMGVFFFNFSSQGLIAANKPVHVKVVFYITQGLNISDLLPLKIILPDAYLYPLKPDPLNTTYEAGIIEINPAVSEGPASGESNVLFPQSGKFGYILFSKEQPVWINVFEPSFYPIVEIESAFAGTFQHAIDSVLTISLLEFGTFIEIVVFRRKIELIGDKRRRPRISRTGAYVAVSILFSFVVYFSGTVLIGMSDSESFGLAVGVGVALFVGLIRYR